MAQLEAKTRLLLSYHMLHIAIVLVTDVFHNLVLWGQCGDANGT